MVNCAKRHLGRCKKCQEKENKIHAYENIINATLWMAIRYAHGRHTFSASTVREAVKLYQKLNKEFVLKPDVAIQPPSLEDYKGTSLMCFRDDWLDDLFREANEKEAQDDK